MAQSSSDAAPISTHPTEEEDVTVDRTPEEEEARLRYLEFVPKAAAQAPVLAAAACAYAKRSTGPLRPRVDHIEGTIKAVVGPVYDRYHAVPLDLLKFLDSKIKDTSVLVRLRPAWEDLRSYLIARGRKCFEVYVCTMVERDYALEMWRLLYPDSRLINYVQLSDRMVCVKSEALMKASCQGLLVFLMRMKYMISHQLQM